MTGEDKESRVEQHTTEEEKENRGEQHTTGEDKESRGEQHMTEEETENRGEQQSTEEEKESRGEQHTTGEDKENRGEQHMTGEDKESRGEQHMTEEETENRGEQHMTGEDKENRGEQHTIEEETENRGEQHMTGEDKENRGDLSCSIPSNESFGELLSCSLNIASGITIMSDQMETDCSSWDTDDELPLKSNAKGSFTSDWDTDDENPLCIGNASTPTKLQTEDHTSVTEICIPCDVQSSQSTIHPMKRKTTTENLTSKRSKLSSDYSDSDSSDIELPSDYSDSDGEDADKENLREESKSSFDLNKLSWKKPFRQIRKQAFNGPSPGSKLGLDPKATELEYFFSFFPESMFEEMVHSTNDYVPIYEAKRQKNDPEWTDASFRPVTTDEMKAFLGIQMIMGINVLPSCDDYWSSDLGLQNALISQTMSRGRFREIKRYFHIRDPSKDPSNIKDYETRKSARREDPLYKVQTLLDHVRVKCRENYHLHEHVSLDEAMVKFHGRHWGVVGAPNKPAKRGFKIFTLADGETGYMADFDVYLRSEKQVGSSQKVVEDLTSRLQGLNHVVYVDKYYTSIPLALSLLSNDIYICGSFNHARKGWPSHLKPQKKLAKKQDPVRSLQRGQSISYQSNDGKMLASVWKDSSLVSHLTTCYSSNASVVSRNIRDKDGRWNKTQLDCPSSIKEYNKYMGGVDRHDHLRSNYSLQRISSKWWLYFAWFAVDIALVNGYITYAEAHPKTTHKKFHMEVAKQLIGGFTQKVYRSRQQATTSGAHLDAERAREHLCVLMTGRARVCKHCTVHKIKTRSGRTRETKYGCEQCMVNLHRECFQSFHDSKVRQRVEMSTIATQTMQISTPTKTPVRCSPRKLRKSFR